MSNLAEVRLWGRTIGAVALDDNNDNAAFEYDSAFVRSGIKIAPLTMPLSNRVYTFPELPEKTFYGLPGLLADSLPDKFGSALIDAWLATQGRQPNSFNAIERLCYTGERGMGALEFAPIIGPRARRAGQIQIGKLVELASEVLRQRNDLQVSFTDEGRAQALTELLRVGTSAGGEEALGVRLLNRSTRSLSLTDAGRVYFERVEPIVDEIEQANRAVTWLHDEVEGRLRVTAPQLPGTLLVADWVLEFQTRYPRVQIELRLENQYMNLPETGFDIAFRVGPLSDSGLVASDTSSH